MNTTSSDLFPVSLDVMIDEVRREISQRRQVYPRLVTEKLLHPVVATRRIEILEALLVKLKAEAAS